MIKKLLLFMMLCVSTVVAWAQATHTSYKFNAESDGTLFMDANGETAATYAANGPCSGTYYLKVNYQHTGAPATKDGPKTFNVKDYYIDGVCTYNQEYDDQKAYSTISGQPQPLEGAELESKLTTAKVFGSSCGDWWYMDGDVEYKVQPGDPCIADRFYSRATPWNQYNGQLGSAMDQWTVEETTAFESTEGIYTLSDGIYTQIPTTAYDENVTYYVVTFAAADPTAVAADANFETSKLYDLSGVTEPIYHKNGTSYDVVVDGEPFIDDDEYYVDGTSYQPCTPAELAALDYATGTTKMYNCDVTESVDKESITVKYEYYGGSWEGYGSMLDYINDAPDALSNHINLIVVDETNSEGLGNDKDKMKASLSSALNNISGVTNVVLSDIFNNRAIDFDFSNLNNSDIKRIILPTADRENLEDITNSETTPVIFEIVTRTTSKVLVSSPAAGSLAAIKDFHYYSDDINAAERQVYFGEINAGDIAWFDGVKVSQLDLSAINTSDEHLDDVKAALHVLKNNVIEYVVFPDLKVKPEDPLYTDFLTNCPNVIAVGQFTSDDQTFNAYSKQAGKISILTEMLDDLTYDTENEKAKGLIKNAKISGTLNAKDLNGGSNVIDAEGHYTTSGGTGVGALIGVQLDALDLENANFFDEATETEYFNDMTISAFGIFAEEPAEEDIQKVTLPKSDKVTIIPEGCLKNLRGLRYICIPYNIKEIRTSAFEFCDIEQVTCTDALGDLIDYGIYTYALPAQLTLIQTNAFNTRRPQNIHDIYVLARKAPKCEAHSFSTKNTWGDGGFMGNNAHPISRANYKNGVNLISILHFPTALPDEEKKKYTDITRKYSLADETGATDDDGNLWMWPHHGQLYRSFDQADAGVIWDDWRPTSDPNFSWAEEGTWDPSSSVTEDYSKETARAIATNGTVNGGGSNGWAEGKDASMEDSYDYNYVGWHEFVLTGSTNYNDTPDPEEKPKNYWNFSKFKVNDWYTLCVPFNMTRDDLARVFGAKAHDAVYYTEKEIANAVEGDDAYGKTTGDVKIPAVLETLYPDVVTLAGVTRNVNTLHIQLQLSDNLLSKSLNVNSTTGLVEVTEVGGQYKPQYTARAGSADDIIIEANKPYFIKPCIPEAEIALANAGKRAVEYTPMASTDTQTPYIMHHVNALNSDQTKFLDWQDNDCSEVPSLPYKYYFVGNYIEQTMPKYAYYLGAKSGVSTIFRNTKDNKKWTVYTTVIGGVASTNSSLTTTGGGKVDQDVTNTRIVFTAEEDFTFSQETPNATKATTFTFAFTEEDNNIVTGVMIPGEGGSMTFIPSDSKVYNINGQLIGTSIENLSKGLYVINGKKIIVR